MLALRLVIVYLYFFSFNWSSCRVGALERVVIRSGRFVGADSGEPFEIVGILYNPLPERFMSGSLDTLSDPDACLRDAALFQKLGINSIAVNVVTLSKQASHDICMSIFNAAGIYVALFWAPPINSEAYLTRRLRTLYSSDSLRDPLIFKDELELVKRGLWTIDVFATYQNLLMYVVTNELIEPLEQPAIRALIRDVKLYIARHSIFKDIPVGISLDYPLSFEQSTTSFQKLMSLIHYIRCIKEPEMTEESTIDFLGLRLFVFETFGSTVPLNSFYWSTTRTARLIDDLTDALNSTQTPLVFTRYREFWNRTIDDTTLFAGSDDSFLTNWIYNTQKWQPVVAGGFFLTWSDKIRWLSRYENISIVDIDLQGNLQLLPPYEGLSQALRNIVHRIQKSVTEDHIESTRSLPTCSFEVSRIDLSTSLEHSEGSDFPLPTAAPALKGILDKGASGRPGFHRHVLQTKVTQTVRDVRGHLISNLAITFHGSTPTSASKGDGSATSRGTLLIILITVFGFAAITLIGALVWVFGKISRVKSRHKPRQEPESIPLVPTSRPKYEPVAHDETGSTFEVGDFGRRAELTIDGPTIHEADHTRELHEMDIYRD